MKRKKKQRGQENIAEMDARETMKQLKKSKKGLDREEIAKMVTLVCEQVLDLERQIEISKKEYEAVTSYLTDMQRIDGMELSKRQQVNDAARSITNLTRERFKYQNSGERIPPEKYRAMERYEKLIPDELKSLYEQEQYQNMINSDLRQLEGERGVIVYEKEQAADKKIFLRQLAVGSCVLLILLFGTLLAVSMLTGADMLLPLLMTAAMAAGIAAYIAVTAGKCERILKESDYRMNRVIQLTNKVKIKLVNSTNALEYSYEKYQVESYQELAALWERYVRTKDEEKRYRKSTELLEHYNNELIAALRTEEVKDAEIWIYQTEALLNDKEMVEVRHHLNTRRQKIRERLEYNLKQLELCKKELRELADDSEAYQELIEKIIGQYGITT